jgi:hypothetical protein
MAFETFLTIDKQKPKKGRRLLYALSGAVHVALLLVGVAVSYAHVDELAPKDAIPITMLTMPTAAPPPAQGGRKEVIKRQVRVKVVPPKGLVQPPEPRKDPSQDPPTRDDDDEIGNGKPGVKNGVPGGTGVIGDPTPQNQFLPPNVARGQLAIDPQAEQYRAHLPAIVQRSGMALAALMKVCVDRNGAVVEVKMLRGVSSEIDAAFISAIRTWRYKPFMVGDHTVPFCTSVHYQVSNGG